MDYPVVGTNSLPMRDEPKLLFRQAVKDCDMPWFSKLLFNAFMFLLRIFGQVEYMQPVTEKPSEKPPE